MLTNSYFQLLGDMSTWRSELKKIAITHAPIAFSLTPPDAIAIPARAAWVENAASRLLENSVFLRNGIDDNVCILFAFGMILITVSTGEDQQLRSPVSQTRADRILLHR